MKLVASKISTGHIGSERGNGANNYGVICSLSRSSYNTGLKYRQKRVEYKKLKCEFWGNKSCFFTDSSRLSHRDISSMHAVSCINCSGETKECSRKSENARKISREQIENARTGSSSEWNSTPVESDPRNSAVHLSDACNFVHNDAKFVNERAKNDIVLLSRGIIMLDSRARQDVAVLGNEFLKLDARARKDTKKIDNSVKKKAARLQHIATILKDRAHSKLKTVADEHWSDGALEADLRRADVMAKRRAMEDSYMALKFVKDIHDMMANKKIPKNEGSLSADNLMGYITLERNGKTSDLFPGDISTDRIAAIQQAYCSMASALSEADGIDYTDPEELELLVATLIDLDAMDGKGGLSLLAECSCSPDVNTRKALANALAAAPSMWILGNAGMGALQRLADDSNPAIAAAASKAIEELRRQWEMQEGDSFTFVVNQSLPSKDADKFSLDEDSA